jgi:thiamine pyrophosphokinase
MPAEEDVSRPAVIFSGGNPLPRSPLALIDPRAFVVAADAGLHAALGIGIRVDLVVGDLDSADPAVVAEARRAGAAVEANPRNKDATALELALEAVRDRDLSPVRVLGGSSLDRVDHFLANALLLTAAQFAGLRVDWWVENARVVIVRDRAALRGDVGDLVTILAVGGPVTGIVTDGLRWELNGETLDRASTRGVSNLMTAEHASVSIEQGVAMVIHTGAPQP